MRSLYLVTTALVVCATSAAAQTIDERVDQGFAPLPAVSSINTKLEVSGFHPESGDMLGTIAGSLTFPIGHSFGLQIDGAGSLGEDTSMYGIGAHLFWRDPSTGLIGLYGSATTAEFRDLTSGSTVFVGSQPVAPATTGPNSVLSTGLSGGEIDINAYTVAAEIESYFGDFSVEGLIGATVLDIPGARSDVFDDATLLASATLGYYATEDLRFDVGWQHGAGGHAASAGLEWQAHSTGSTGYSGFARGQYTEGGAMAATVGLRLYWGEGQSLIERHRQDDPVIHLTSEFNQIGSRGLSEAMAASGDPESCPASLDGENLFFILVVDQSVPAGDMISTSSGTRTIIRAAPEKAKSLAVNEIGGNQSYDEGDIQCVYGSP